MAEPQDEFEKAEPSGRLKKWLVGTVILLAAVLMCLAILWIRRDRTTLRKRITAIEAARAVPDEENAALLYTKLSETSDIGADAPEFFSWSKPSSISGPWVSAEHPQTADWLKRHQDTIAKLMEVSRKEKCAFTIDFYPGPFEGHIDLLAAMRRWGLLLLSAANNDIAEGRTAPGVEKYLCIIGMAKHLDQQPIIIDFLASIALEFLALDRMKPFILEGDISKEALDSIEQALPKTEPNWKQHVSDIFELDQLYAERNLPLLHRMAFLFRRDDRRTLKQSEELYRRVHADRRGLHILIALRRYKNKTGQWPEKLDDVKALAPAENFVDPINDDSFVYKLTEENFTLYSKGKDSIDEDGRRHDGADDWPVWPLKISKTKEENADDEQSGARSD